MNLQELIKWASDYDVTRIEQEKNKRNRASTYLGMIVDKGTKVLENNRQNTDYMENVQEYLDQLKKIGVTHIVPPSPSSLEDGGKKEEEPKKESPLIP